MDVYHWTHCGVARLKASTGIDGGKLTISTGSGVARNFRHLGSRGIKKGCESRSKCIRRLSHLAALLRTKISHTREFLLY